MAGTRTFRAAAATAAAGDALSGASSSYAYGVERRSIALRASWIAMCAMAYMRDSCSGLSSGAMHAARAAAPALAFQASTASGGSAGESSAVSAPRCGGSAGRRRPGGPEHQRDGGARHGAHDESRQGVEVKVIMAGPHFRSAFRAEGSTSRDLRRPPQRDRPPSGGAQPRCSGRRPSAIRRSSYSHEVGARSSGS